MMSEPQAATPMALDRAQRFRPPWPGAGDGRLRRRPGERLRVGLLIPQSGPAGIWGPSCHSAAFLAVAELNRDGGVAGREVELLMLDAGRGPAEVALATDRLLEDEGVEAVVGMHISAVRQALAPAVGGRVPYVYTALYEGGERRPGVYAIGETPAEQIKPAIAWLSGRRRARRWFLAGNDYVWPRASHRLAAGWIRAAGGSVLDDVYLPLGSADFSALIARIAAARPDALLLSMVGDDAVAFNRQFAAASLAPHMLRLSAAVEENGLLAIGAASAENLYVAAGYFAGLQSDRNLSFLERYRSAFGLHPPVPNTLGQGCYEGIRFLAALLAEHRGDRGWPDAVAFEGARGRRLYRDHAVASPTYLAEAEGHDFRVVAAFGGAGIA